MPDDLEDRINDLTGHTITFHNGTHNVTKPRHKSNPYFHRVLSNLREECNGLKEEVNDMMLIWYSSFNRKGTNADDDSVLGDQMDASDYELNGRRPGPTKLPKGDDNNFIPGVPPQYEPRRDAERETHYRRGTSPDDVSEQVKEDWRYWAARKMNGQWPPTYWEMHLSSGSSLFCK